MLLWIIRLALVLLFLILFLLRGTRAWAIGLITVSVMVALDALRSRGILIELDFLGYVLGGMLAAGAFLWLNGIAQSGDRFQSASRTSVTAPVEQISGVRVSAKPTGANSAENKGFDRQLIFEQIRDNLGSDDVLDLIFDLSLKENEIVNPGQSMPNIIMRVLDEAEKSNQMTQLALSVERILTPMPKDHLPRIERLSAETPPHLLRQFLIQNYTVSDLALLSSKLGIDWQDMGSDHRKSRVRRLLLHLQRRSRTSELVALLHADAKL